MGDHCWWILDPFLHAWDKRIVETVDSTKRTSSEKGEDGWKTVSLCCCNGEITRIALRIIAAPIVFAVSSFSDRLKNLKHLLLYIMLQGEFQNLSFSRNNFQGIKDRLEQSDTSWKILWGIIGSGNSIKGSYARRGHRFWIRVGNCSLDIENSKNSF